MKIYHVLPGGHLHWVPHIIRIFLTDHQRMGTEAEDHHFIIVGAPTAERESLPCIIGTAADRLGFLEARVSAIARFLRSAEGDSLLVFHGIFFLALWEALLLTPRVRPRVVWVIWGGDLYFLREPSHLRPTPRGIYRWFRAKETRLLMKRLVRQLGSVSGGVPGDFDVLRSEVGPIANCHRALYSDRDVRAEPPVPETRRSNTAVGVCVGNSATESNRHAEALRWLSRFKDEHIRIICPLTYGDPEYRDRVVAMGEDLFGHKFQPLLEMLDRDDYFRLLRSLDVLVFNHNRQQGIGALLTMLFAGKKCFLRSDVSTYAMLQEYGIASFPTESLSSSSFAEFSNPLTPEVIEETRQRCQEYLSRDACVAAWKRLFAHFDSRRASGHDIRTASP